MSFTSLTMERIEVTTTLHKNLSDILDAHFRLLLATGV